MRQCKGIQFKASTMIIFLHILTLGMAKWYQVSWYHNFCSIILGFYPNSQLKRPSWQHRLAVTFTDYHPSERAAVPRLVQKYL